MRRAWRSAAPARAAVAVPAAVPASLALALLLAGCRSDASAGELPGPAAHVEEEERMAPEADLVPPGFVRGGAAGLARARKAKSGAMLFFAATW